MTAMACGPRSSRLRWRWWRSSRSTWTSPVVPPLAQVVQQQTHLDPVALDERRAPRAPPGDRRTRPTAAGAVRPGREQERQEAGRPARVTVHRRFRRPGSSVEALGHLDVRLAQEGPRDAGDQVGPEVAGRRRTRAPGRPRRRAATSTALAFAVTAAESGSTEPASTTCARRGGRAAGVVGRVVVDHDELVDQAGAHGVAHQRLDDRSDGGGLVPELAGTPTPSSIPWRPAVRRGIDPRGGRCGSKESTVGSTPAARDGGGPSVIPQATGPRRKS